MRIAIALGIALTLLPALARQASAHLLPAQQATANVVGDSVFVAASLPVSALHDFDDDGDGLLGAAELERHGAALRSELDRRLVILDGDVVGTTVGTDLVLSPPHEATDRADQVVALKHVRFVGPPTDLGVSSDLFGIRESEQSLVVTATRPGDSGKKEKQVATLTPEAREHRFFHPALEPHERAERAPSGTDPLLLLGAIVVVGLRKRGKKEP